MHEHNSNTAKQACKLKRQSAIPEQQKRCQTRHHQTTKHNRNLCTKQDIKTRTKASEKTRNCAETGRTLRKIIKHNSYKKTSIQTNKNVHQTSHQVSQQISRQNTDENDWKIAHISWKKT